jgi:hypothetical protein
MAKRRIVDVSADLETVPSEYRRSIPLLPRQNVALADLRLNPQNAKIFRQESEEYFERLREDIRKRGIVVPLIAKKDGTLLAGHNRYTVAQELNLQYVPVEYVKEDLSAEREQEFLIKDNLLRRQFTAQEWIGIYTKLYPDFEAHKWKKCPKILDTGADCQRDGAERRKGKNANQTRARAADKRTNTRQAF